MVKKCVKIVEIYVVVVIIPVIELVLGTVVVVIDMMSLYGQ